MRLMAETGAPNPSSSGLSPKATGLSSGQGRPSARISVRGVVDLRGGAAFPAGKTICTLAQLGPGFSGPTLAKKILARDRPFSERKPRRKVAEVAAPRSFRHGCREITHETSLPRWYKERGAPCRGDGMALAGLDPIEGACRLGETTPRDRSPLPFRVPSASLIDAAHLPQLAALGALLGSPAL